LWIARDWRNSADHPTDCPSEAEAVGGLDRKQYLSVLSFPRGNRQPPGSPQSTRAVAYREPHQILTQASGRDQVSTQGLYVRTAVDPVQASQRIAGNVERGVAVDLPSSVCRAEEQGQHPRGEMDTHATSLCGGGQCLHLLQRSARQKYVHQHSGRPRGCGDGITHMPPVHYERTHGLCRL